MSSKRGPLESRAKRPKPDRADGVHAGGEREETAEELADPCDFDASHELCNRIRIDLEMRGVGPDLAPTLANELAERAGGLADESYVALLDGVALTCRMHSSADLEIVRNACDVREVERMVRDFAGELNRLDETLEVLAAYVARMRSSLGAKPTGTIH